MILKKRRGKKATTTGEITQTRYTMNNKKWEEKEILANKTKSFPVN